MAMWAIYGNSEKELTNIRARDQDFVAVCVFVWFAVDWTHGICTELYHNIFVLYNFIMSQGN